MQNKIVAIIVAAGDGVRIDSDIPKQYIKIKDKPILLWTLEKFIEHPAIDEVIVVINKSHEQLYLQSIPENIRKHLLPHVFGGARRQDSVRFGLEALQEMQPALVLIHDAARVFIKAEQISDLINAVKICKHGAALGIEIADTVYQIKDETFISVPRQKLMKLQTPQCFSYELIQKLHEKYKHETFTDDVGLLLRDKCHEIKIVKSSIRNFKITTLEDLKLAETILDGV